ncbi:hypothetical protein [Rhodococcus sp. JS3073]|uniref:hypothetical protein n=1 Tax=Rhodococcus sp. JS3073 TaxID=3002901 RepID=UPI0022862BB9|nr:hypothetical protein [Rhodococcus sp. JS3073]WAM19189.1 hypothetical protein OYT95_42440 [Rhodococcus sp. JS3073]
MVNAPDPGLDLNVLRGLRAPSAKAGPSAVADIAATPASIPIAMRFEPLIVAKVFRRATV